MTKDEILSTTDRKIEHDFFKALVSELQRKGIPNYKIAEKIGVSSATICNRLGSDKNCKKPLRADLRTIIDCYNVEFQSFNIISQFIEDFRMVKGTEDIRPLKFMPRAFKKNKIWLVYSDLTVKIGVRILKVLDNGKIEYLVNSPKYGDYEGHLNTDTNKPVLILDLKTKTSNNDDLRIYLWVHDMESTPSIMAGVLTYYRTDGVIDSHKILAIPAQNDDQIAGEINTLDFQKNHPLLAQYFHIIRPTRLYSTSGIYDFDTLK